MERLSYPSADTVRTEASAQTKYNPAYFEAAFYECRKLVGGWPFVPLHVLRKAYNMGGEL